MFSDVPSILPAIHSGIFRVPMAFLTCNGSFSGGLLQLHIGGSTKGFFSSFMTASASYFSYSIVVRGFNSLADGIQYVFQTLYLLSLGHTLFCDFIKLLKSYFSNFWIKIPFHLYPFVLHNVIMIQRCRILSYFHRLSCSMLFLKY